MASAEVEDYLGKIEGWGHSEHRRISRTFDFPDFVGRAGLRQPRR